MGGEEFEKTATADYGAVFTWVSSNQYTDDANKEFLIGTDAGVFLVTDQIPRGRWYQRVWKVIEQNPLESSGAFLVLLLLVALSTRLILIFMQLDVQPIKSVAPWFYLTGFGRWKLYRRYRRALMKDPEIQTHARWYVDLPYEWERADGKSEESALSERIGQSIAAQQRIVVIAAGGRGKTTLCRYVALSAAQGDKRIGRRRLEPVVIEGLAYDGNLVEAVTSSLKQYRAYVNSTIVESQLTAGNLLVLFDGFSEIREAFRPAAESDIPSFVKQHPDTRFLFTSRSPLPPAVHQALGDPASVKLSDVDEKTERIFLSQYLKRGEREVDNVISEMGLRFPDLPRIPLMLKLVATVYDRTGQVPKDRTTLFAAYVEQLLRSEVTGIDEPAGLNFVLRHLVRETYVRSGGDRGLTIERGVELLETIKDRLESFDIRLSPIKLLNMLTRAGLYRRVGEYLRFFHDSFESYFASRALESDFREKRYELLVECASNDRLFETWDFLLAILEDTGDVPKLREVISTATQKSAISNQAPA